MRFFPIKKRIVGVNIFFSRTTHKPHMGTSTKRNICLTFEIVMSHSEADLANSGFHDWEERIIIIVESPQGSNNSEALAKALKNLNIEKKPSELNTADTLRVKEELLNDGNLMKALLSEDNTTIFGKVHSLKGVQGEANSAMNKLIELCRYTKILNI